MKKTVIGIIGTVASGKDLLGEYLSKKLEIPIFQISQPIIDTAKKRGIPLTRKNTTKFAQEFAREFGEDYSARIYLEKITDKGIITGMRQLAQIDYLKKNSNLILIAIDAEPEIRFQRAKERNKIKEATTLKEFIQDEKEENSGDNVQKIFNCIKLADYKINNNSTLDELYSKIDKIIKK